RPANRWIAGLLLAYCYRLTGAFWASSKQATGQRSGLMPLVTFRRGQGRDKPVANPGKINCVAETAQHIAAW
ncbi:MAG TPA: hypothetical protein VGI96_28850, partial [Streptosporangiaceae bacterium]